MMLVLIKAGPNLRQVPFRGWGKKVAEGNRGLDRFLRKYGISCLNPTVFQICRPLSSLGLRLCAVVFR